jgi:DNA-binding SARP family transcriptional activator
VQVTFGVLGPVTAWDGTGRAIALKGPRHRAVLARLIAAHRRVVPVGVLIEDLWDDPPAGAVSAVRTFVGALRRALEPARPPRAPAGLLVTDGPGYALRAGAEAVDAWRFEQAVAATAALPPGQVVTRLEEAMAGWRGQRPADLRPGRPAPGSPGRRHRRRSVASRGASHGGGRCGACIRSARGIE